jgi:hypothetical protein
VAQVNCIVDEGDLPLTIAWSFHGKNIDAAHMGINTFKVGARTSILSIETVTAAHSGLYSCVARNSAGEDKFSAPLEVFGSNISKQSSIQPVELIRPMVSFISSALSQRAASLASINLRQIHHFCPFFPWEFSNLEFFVFESFNVWIFQFEYGFTNDFCHNEWSIIRLCPSCGGTLQTSFHNEASFGKF